MAAGFIPGFVATVLGVSTDSPASFRYPLMLGALIVAGAAIVLLSTREAAVARNEEETRGKAPVAQIARLVSIGMLLHVSVPAYRTFFNVYLDAGLGVRTPVIGALWGISNLLSLSALLMPSLVTRWGKRRTVVIAGTGISASILPIALFAHWIPAAGSLFVRSIMDYIRLPAYDQVIQESVGARWRPVATGAYSTCTGAVMFAMAFAGGYIATAFGYQAVFTVAAVFTGIGVVLTAVFLKSNEVACT
jgi:hypothetical protein